MSDQINVTNEKSAALQRIDEAMLLIKDTDKAAYLEAKEIAPELVLNESDPEIFLQYSKNNAAAAAKRLTQYWAWRKEVFKDNAYKPLNQLGTGALSKDDIEILNTGGFALLPNLVILNDRSRFSKTMLENPDGRLRCLFYVLSLAVNTLYQSEKNKKGSTPGALVSLVRLGSNDVLGNSHDFYLTRKLVDLVQNCLPVSVSGIHLVALPPSEETTSITRSAYRLVVASLVSIIVQMLGSFFGQCVTHHSGSSTKELLQKLKSSGFTKRGLPVCMGGNWSDESFEQFQRRQHRLEEEMFLSEAEKLQRKREVNRIHSRQKRTRRRIEWEVLNDQVSDLQYRNETLKRQNEELENLLKMAQMEVKLCEEGQQGRGCGSAQTSQLGCTGAPVQALDKKPSASEFRQELGHQDTLERLAQASLLQQQLQRHQQIGDLLPTVQATSSVQMQSFLQNRSQYLADLFLTPNLEQQQQRTAATQAAAFSAAARGHQLPSDPTLIYPDNSAATLKIAPPPTADWLVLHQPQSAIPIRYDEGNDGNSIMAGGLAAQLQLQRQQQSVSKSHQEPANRLGVGSIQEEEERFPASLQHTLGSTAQRYSSLFDTQQKRLNGKDGYPPSR